LAFSLGWLNKGVAPAYNKYLLWVKLEGATTHHLLPLDNADPQSWLPGSPVLEDYTVALPENMKKGTYKVKIKMTKADAEKRPVLLGLSNQRQDADGFYELFWVRVR
jgi:hypothetical protein